ncbi:MAG: hypothetical protein DDT34_02005 [Firmicutes bacterium]|nr:hypothetical protein [Bacillota bacterium]
MIKLKHILVAALAAFTAAARAETPITDPVHLIENLCVRSAHAVNDAREGADIAGRLAALRIENESIRTEILNRLEATEIERNLRLAGGDRPWDVNREAAAKEERTPTTAEVNG